MNQEHLHYQDLSVTNFRGLQQVTFPELARVNLITGRNNSGKSSLLEAIRIHAANGATDTLHDILVEREEYSEPPDPDDPVQLPWDQWPIASIFHRQTDDAPAFDPITISTARSRTNKDTESPGSAGPAGLTLKLAWFPSLQAESGRWTIDHQSEVNPGHHQSEPALAVYSPHQTKAYPLDQLFPSPNFNINAYSPYSNNREDHTIPCSYTGPYLGHDTSQLAILWDNIVLTDAELDVTQAVRTIAPTLQAIGMVGRQGSRSARYAMARTTNSPKPVSVKSLGNGTIRLFSIILPLVNAKTGILLVDEIDNSLDQEVHQSVWNTIFQLAQDHKVQVFATTDNDHTVATFLESTKRFPSQGKYLYL